MSSNHIKFTLTIDGNTPVLRVYDDSDPHTILFRNLTKDAGMACAYFTGDLDKLRRMEKGYHEYEIRQFNIPIDMTIGKWTEHVVGWFRQLVRDVCGTDVRFTVDERTMHHVKEDAAFNKWVEDMRKRNNGVFEYLTPQPPPYKEDENKTKNRPDGH